MTNHEKAIDYLFARDGGFSRANYAVAQVYALLAIADAIANRK